MKKTLFLLILFMILLNPARFYSQLDREHWFPPMYDGQSNTGAYQYLYLSTNETTPFTAYVYNNNNLIYQTVISKGSPQYITIDRSYIITTSTTDLHTVKTMGLYVTGDHPFFANLRFGMINHAEIITSKGTAGIGTKFYTVSVPNKEADDNYTNLGFGASFLATEDNTTVTVNNFKKTLTFNGYGTTTSFTFTLNKGQSYIIDGRASASVNNRDGFIGATVTSDKPIAMANGSFNGQFSSLANNSDGSDIYMDETVPTDKLGNEFVLVKGYGHIGTGPTDTGGKKMEGAIIVATKPNTQIFLNDATTPIATLATPGDYYSVDEINYINRGNDHYNLHIRTSEDVYVYQMLGGVEFDSGTTSALATGGMNYIPPLNCYLPKKIDEIGTVNLMGSQLPFTTKLNIITSKGATLTVNGAVPNALYGPYDISTIPTDQTWVTYSIPNVTGTITIDSDKAVTAGIAGGTAAYGFGGYFAGFSATPLIQKIEAECVPEAKLAVTEGFDSYLWLLKDNLGNYNPAPTTLSPNNLYYYYPPQAGIYACRVRAEPCQEIQTPDFKFFNCTDYTNYDYDICSTIDIISPQFVLSSQTINPSSVQITVPPTKGTATVNNVNGTITYTANPNATGVDTFKYTFCGVGSIPDCETAQATIHIHQIISQDAVLKECESENGIATYDLSQANVTADNPVTKVYYHTQAGAQNETVSDIITDFTEFTTADTTVYVRIKNSFDCYSIQAIQLQHNSNPTVSPDQYTTAHCDEEDGIIDGNYVVTLDSITPAILVNPSAYTVKYYDSETKANLGGNDNITGNYAFIPPASVWIRVTSSEGCFTVKEIPLTIGNKVGLITDNLNANVCDAGLDNTETVNLADYIPELTSAAGVAATYYSTMEDAVSQQSPIPATQTIGTGTTSFYYVITKAGFCANVATLNLTMIIGEPSTTLPDSITICEDATTVLDAGTAHTGFEWHNDSNPNVIIGTNETQTVGPGTYFVILTSPNGCQYKQDINVIGYPIAQLDVTPFNATFCDDDFDGIINIKFSTQVTPIILPNSNLFTINYYDDPSMTTPLPDDWSFTANTTVYIKVTSPFCGDLTGVINFKIGDRIPLITNSANLTVCDADYSGSDDIDLNDYKNLFLNPADMSIQPKFYLTLADAQQDTGALSSGNVTLTGDITYYYRFETAEDNTDSRCANIGELIIKYTKGFASTTLPDSITICEDATTVLDAGTAHTGFEWHDNTTGAVIGTNQTITVGAGSYFVILTSPDGCQYKQNIDVTGYPIAQLDTTLLNATYCDDNIDGFINIKFSTDVTPVILQNSNLYTTNYYSDPGMTNLLPDNWSFSADTTVYVKVTSPYCSDVTGVINFKIGAKIPLLSYNETVDVCDDDLDGIKLVDNLEANYGGLFTNDATAIVKFYVNQIDAQNDAPDNISQVTVNGDQTLYIRISNGTDCPDLAKLTIHIKVPTASMTLEDEVVCPDTTTVLNAGPGFTKYEWHDVSDPDTIIGTEPIITVGVGSYSVTLTSPNGCTYTQYAQVTEAEMPVIESIDINGSTVTVIVTGGTPPYQYALDNGVYQDSNTFLNVPPGVHTIYVISADKCTPISQELSVIEIYNVITPNNDGYNDVLDMSMLKYKVGVKFQIYDRNGVKVFEGTPNNNYIWDGKLSGRVLPTSSYWYIMEWQDYEGAVPVKYTGWILLKNRD